MRRAPLVLALLLLAHAAEAQEFESVRIDQNGRVQATTKSGRRVTLSARGDCADAAVSPDHRTVAWFELETIDYHEKPVKVAKVLRWIRGRARHHHEAGIVIFRDFWFVDGGKKIAVNVGGMHFAGLNVLFDAASGKWIADYPDASQEPRPPWVDARGY